MAMVREHEGVIPTAPIRIVAPGKEWGVEPVELMVERGVEKVPLQFRRVSVEEEMEGLSLSEKHDLQVAGEEATADLSIPIIDLKSWDAKHREEIVAKVRDACVEWGFFRIVNHGVDAQLMERMMQAAKDFIALPVQEKAAYVGRPGTISQGYGSKYVIGAEEAVRDWRDYLFLWLQPLHVRDYAYWPSRPDGFKETLEQYSRELKELARRLLGVISEGMGARAELLEEALGEAFQKMLINYYPACPQPELVDGFHQHSDIGALTLVMQEENAPVGLQVHHSSGHWVPAPSLPAHSFVVNIADQIEILTNGRYKSIEHRVVPNRHQSRISIPTFYDAAPDVMISPLKELTREPVYKEVKFDDHEHAFYEYGANGKTMVQSYITHENHLGAIPLPVQS